MLLGLLHIILLLNAAGVFQSFFFLNWWWCKFSYPCFVMIFFFNLWKYFGEEKTLSWGISFYIREEREVEEEVVGGCCGQC